MKGWEVLKKVGSRQLCKVPFRRRGGRTRREDSEYIFSRAFVCKRTGEPPSIGGKVIDTVRYSDVHPPLRVMRQRQTHRKPKGNDDESEDGKIQDDDDDDEDVDKSEDDEDKDDEDKDGKNQVEGTSVENPINIDDDEDDNINGDEEVGSSTRNPIIVDDDDDYHPPAR